MGNTKTAVVTGANRGIGRALVDALRAGACEPVIASFRDEQRSGDLLGLAERDAHVIPLPLDVTSDMAVSGFAEACSRHVERVDVLINNAGIPASRGSILDAPIEDLELHAQTHAIGMVRVIQAMLPFLQPGAVIANISSVLAGSDGIGCHYTHYAPAKAFQNALTQQLAACLRSRRIAVLAIHPGWVATEIGGRGAPISPAASARDVARVVLSSTVANTGTFVDQHGRSMRW